MSLIATSSRCFNALEAAVEAVKTGNADRSAVIIESIRQDGLLLQKQASILCDKFKKDEEKHQELDKDLTRQINKLYAEEVELKNRRQALEAKKSALNGERDLCCRNKRDASRRYENARAEKKEAEEKCEEVKNWWWVPGYGQYLFVRECVENNEEKARDARREMERYDGEMSRADRNIRSANTAISQVEKDQNEISRKVKELKGQRDDCHEELGNIKTLTSFIMQAITFWEEVTMLTNAATIKTAQVQKIVDLAAKKNTLKILKSRGTAIKMRSFRESWMEVAEMFGSDTNSLRFIDRNLHFPVNEVKLGEESERHSLLSPCVLVVVLLVAVVSCFLRWLS